MARRRTRKQRERDARHDATAWASTSRDDATATWRTRQLTAAARCIAAASTCIAPARTTVTATIDRISGTSGRPSCDRKCTSRASRPISDATSNASAALVPLSIGPRPPASSVTIADSAAVNTASTKPICACSGPSREKATSP